MGKHGGIKEILESRSMNIATREWVKGTWEHIDPKNPNLKIESKEHLKKECEKHGVIPKAFLKSKSQEKGWEASW